MSKAKASLCVIVATCVAVMALFFAPKPALSTLQTAVITRGGLQIACMLQGVVAYSNTRWLPAPATGQVQRVYRQPGERMEAGELVLEMEYGAELAALSAMEHKHYVLNTHLEALPAGALTAVAEEVLQWNNSRAQLLAAIAAKQIRLPEGGTLSYLYATAGDFVQAGAPLAEIRGDTLCITAHWTANQSRLPVPGMQACWCNDEGTPMGVLRLETVTAAAEGASAGLRLSFVPLDGASLPFQAGTPVSVRLVLDTLPEAGLVPLDALDSNGRLWFLREGRVVPETIPLGEACGSLVQVPAELVGLRVVMEPEGLALREGHPVRMAGGS